MSGTKTAELYRMVMEDHLCPYGLKSKHLLETQGFQVEDHHLKNHEETEAFKHKHNVETTPQTFLGGDRIGGYDDLLGVFYDFLRRFCKTAIKFIKHGLYVRKILIQRSDSDSRLFGDLLSGQFG